MAVLVCLGGIVSLREAGDESLSGSSIKAFVRWAWRWVALVLVLSSAAYLFAYWASPAEQVFLGFLANNDDNQLYLSYMRDGAQGAWLTTVRFTPEAHNPALLLPMYQVLGKIARVLHLSNELVFHAARLVGGIGLLAVAYWLCVICLPAGTARQSAFLLICFSSGFGWLLAITRLADTVLVPVDIRVPETNTFLTIFTSPHFVLGVTVELLTFVLFLGADRRRGYLFAASLCLLLLSITLVYNVIVVAAVLVGYTVVRCVQQRRVWVPELWRTIAVGLPCTPVVAYYYVLLNHAPFWSVVYGEHIVMRSPGPVALILGYGLVFGLALLGVIHWARRRAWSGTNVLLAMWFVGNGLLLYAPLAFQVRLSAGWHAGMCVVAAVGLHESLLPWVRKQAWFSRWAARSYTASLTVRNVVLILTIPSTLLVALIGFRIALAEHYFPYFLPADDVQAVQWLAARAGEDDVLLSSYGIGNYWVAHSTGRSFLGHQFAVLEPQLKDREMRRFYSGEASDEELRQLVTAHGITYVFYGSLECRLGNLDPDRVSWLTLAHREERTVIYRVQGAYDE
jgi:hypothetical protein